MKPRKILTILVLRSELLRRVALVLALGLMLWLAAVGQAEPMGTAFTYQGLLYDANYVADGLYDLQFKLYDDPNIYDGNQVGGDVNVPEVDVVEGYFTVVLDFNDPNGFKGEARWLEIGVRPGEQNDPNVYTFLDPLQEVTPTPYALYAKSSGGLQSSGDLILKSDTGDVQVGGPNEPTIVHIFGNWRVYRAAEPGEILVSGVYPADFEGASYSEPAEVEWDFGDGNMNTSTKIGIDFTSEGSGSDKVIQADGEDLFIGCKDKPNIARISGGCVVGMQVQGAPQLVYGPSYVCKASGGDVSASGVYPTDFEGDSRSVSMIDDNGIIDVGVYEVKGPNDPIMVLKADGGMVGVMTMFPAATLDVNGTMHASDAVKCGDSISLYEDDYLLSTTGQVIIGEDTDEQGTFGPDIKVGVGTETPEFKLTLDDDGGIIAKGAYGSGTDLTTSGAGARLIWYPKKAAFRAGLASLNEWDNANIGNCSVAMGNKTTASGNFSTVCGGFNGSATGDKSTVCGGASNTASGEESFVGAGYLNTASGGESFVGNGSGNVASGPAAFIGAGGNNEASSNGAAVVAGVYNEASGYASSVGGGWENTASNSYATVPGGYYNTAAGTYSFAAGRRAKANHQGTFVWGDSTDADFASSANNQFLIRASAGVGIRVNNPSEDLDVLGTARLRGISVGGDPNLYPVVADENGKLWKTGISSRRYKTNIEDLETDTDAVLQLRPVSFQYKSSGRQDIGLIAEEVEGAARELVIYDKEGRPDGVRYDKVALYLLDVVKAQQDKITALEQRLEALEKTTQQPFGLAKEVQQ